MCPVASWRRALMKGFTLVEVLIALAILAVGLLGGVALLIEGLRASRSALQQTIAATLAADLAERIRSNPSAGDGYALGEATALSTPARSCAAVAECNTADVAALDLYTWQQAVLTQLPDAAMSIEVEPVAATSFHLFRIVIRWTESGASARSAFSLTLQA
jgi:type IV pilus assembly protein PilV